MKKILSLGLLTLIFSLGANNVNAVPFNYKYEIRTNSLSYNDQLMGYPIRKSSLRYMKKFVYYFLRTIMTKLLEKI